MKPFFIEHERWLLLLLTQAFLSTYGALQLKLCKEKINLQESSHLSCSKFLFAAVPDNQVHHAKSVVASDLQINIKNIKNVCIIFLFCVTLYILVTLYRFWAQANNSF